MSALYWMAFILAAGLLVFSMFGDHHDGHDGLDSHDGDHDGLRIFSIRNATYFLFGFGATGVLLGLLWQGRNDLVTALISGLVGLFSGSAAAVTFGYLRRSQSGDMEDDDSLVGLPGTVVVPISKLGPGKVLVTRTGREHELLARPFDAEATDPETWTSIVVVEMKGGTALVTPFRETLEGADDILRLPPNSEPQQ